MERDQLFHALLPLGLLWLGMLLGWVWRQVRPAPCQTTPTPARPIKIRSKDPKPFPGLIHKPHCDACEHAVEPRLQGPAALSPPLTFTRGRQRAINTQQQFCPDHECAY